MKNKFVQCLKWVAPLEFFFYLRYDDQIPIPCKLLIQAVNIILPKTDS